MNALTLEEDVVKDDELNTATCLLTVEWKCTYVAITANLQTLNWVMLSPCHFQSTSNISSKLLLDKRGGVLRIGGVK